MQSHRAESAFLIVNTFLHIKKLVFERNSVFEKKEKTFLSQIN